MTIYNVKHIPQIIIAATEAHYPSPNCAHVHSFLSVNIYQAFLNVNSRLKHLSCHCWSREGLL